MAISATRVKFLDKENKVLVKALGDFSSNDIFTDFVSAILDTDFALQFQADQFLLNLQNGIGSLFNSLTDDIASRFSIKNLIEDIDLSDPALSHLVSTINTIKTMDAKTVSLFMGSILETVTDRLANNPSLIGAYTAIKGDVKTQTLLTALDVFATKLNSGEVTVSSLTRELKDAGATGLDLTALDTLLTAVRSNKKTVDLDKIVAGTFKVPAGFFTEIIEEVDADVGKSKGVVKTGDDVVPDALTGDYVIDSLLVGYLSIKRQYFRRYAGLRSDGTALLVNTPTLEADVKKGFNDRVFKSFITPVYDNDALLKYIGRLLDDVKTKAISNTTGTAHTFAELDSLSNFIIELINDALANPYMDALTAKYTVAVGAVSSAPQPALAAANAYISSAVDPFNSTTGYTKDAVVNNLLNFFTDSTARLIIEAGKGGNTSKEAEVVGLPIAYMKHRLIKSCLQARKTTSGSCYAAMKIAGYFTDSVFLYKATEPLTAAGYPLDQVVLNIADPVELNIFLVNIYKAIKASNVGLKKIKDVEAKSQGVYSCLKFFMYKYEALTSTATASTYFAVDANFIGLKAAFMEEAVSLGTPPEALSAFTLDTPVYAAKALDLDYVSFSGDKIKIL